MAARHRLGDSGEDTPAVWLSNFFSLNSCEHHFSVNLLKASVGIQVSFDLFFLFWVSRLMSNSAVFFFGYLASSL